MPKKTLNPVPQPVTINTLKLVLMSLIFALVFFVIGYFTMHYPANMGWV